MIILPNVSALLGAGIEYRWMLAYTLAVGLRQYLFTTLPVVVSIISYLATCTSLVRTLPVYVALGEAPTTVATLCHSGPCAGPRAWLQPISDRG